LQSELDGSGSHVGTCGNHVSYVQPVEVLNAGSSRLVLRQSQALSLGLFSPSQCGSFSLDYDDGVFRGRLGGPIDKSFAQRWAFCAWPGAGVADATEQVNMHILSQ